MEIYQWFFRMNGFKVNDTGYFVYCNGKRDKSRFSNRLEFDVAILPYQGTTAWIEKTIGEISDCLNRKDIPQRNEAAIIASTREISTSCCSGIHARSRRAVVCALRFSRQVLPVGFEKPLRHR